MVLFVVNRLKRFLKGEMTVPAHETHPCCSNKRCHAVKNATEMLLISDDWDAKLEEFIQELKEKQENSQKAAGTFEALHHGECDNMDCDIVQRAMFELLIDSLSCFDPNLFADKELNKKSHANQVWPQRERSIASMCGICCAKETAERGSRKKTLHARERAVKIGSSKKTLHARGRVKNFCKCHAYAG